VNEQNLKPFKPGNPKPVGSGKKKGYSSPTAALRKFMDKKIRYEDPETQKMVTGKISDVIALRMVLNASQGEYTALKDIMDRLDGKPADKIQHSGLDDSPLVIRWEK
jgi:hypothetical protein